MTCLLLLAACTLVAGLLIVQSNGKGDTKGALGCVPRLEVCKEKA